MKHQSNAIVSASNGRAVPKQLADWVNSASGQLALSSAVSESQRAVSLLHEARKVRPEQLNTPITL